MKEGHRPEGANAIVFPGGRITISLIFKAVILSILILGLGLIFNTQKVLGSTLSEKETELARLQEKIDHYQHQAALKSSQINSLRSQIEAIRDRILATQAQIQLTQVKIDKTQAEIDETNAKIKQKNKELAYQKSVLDESLRVIYEEGNNGFVESFLTAQTLTDLMDRSEYIDTVEKKIETTMNNIEHIKADLLAYKKDQQNRKSDLLSLRADYNRKRESLSSQRNYKNTLLAQTKGEQSRYKALISSGNESAVQLSSEIYQLRLQQSENNGEQIGGGSSGYPFDSTCGGYDPWGFMKCQCTSYASWKWNNVYGKSWVNTRPGSGSAWNWPALARDQGYTVSSHPRVGAFVIWSQSQIAGGYGHVAIVEAVNGSRISVSEYNYVHLSYSYRTGVYWSGLTFIY